MGPCPVPPAIRAGRSPLQGNAPEAAGIRQCYSRNRSFGPDRIGASYRQHDLRSPGNSFEFPHHKVRSHSQGASDKPPFLLGSSSDFSGRQQASGRRSTGASCRPVESHWGTGFQIHEDRTAGLNIGSKVAHTGRRRTPGWRASWAMK